MTRLLDRHDRHVMDRLAGELLRSLHNKPGDVDGREPLWMKREDLRSRRARRQRCCHH